ncbi:MAG: hypothetical protein ABFD92_05920 [Planctomycetaceae bacterium]|nr:hypothetical protein [Planctomycetaceae bacterium]
MARPWIVLALTAALWLPATGQSPATQSASAPSAPPKRSLDDYRLIVDRNIFSRDRSRRPVAARAYTPPREISPPAPQRHLVLTGVALQGESPIAFFEDSLDGQTLWVQAGMAIGHGTVADISFDGVTYRNGARERTIAIGEDIEGIAVLLQASTSTQSASAPAATPAAPPSSANDNDVLQRLRLRRLQDLQR